MPTGFTNKETPCRICQEPLPIPRRSNCIYHESCQTDAALLYNKKRWKRLSAEERTRNNQRSKNLAQKRRQVVLSHYGGTCDCCGESTLEFLSIDHINGKGTAHRRDVGEGQKFYKWLIASNFPEGFRVLCHNCNMSYGFYGYCHHQDRPC